MTLCLRFRFIPRDSPSNTSPEGIDKYSYSSEELKNEFEKTANVYLVSFFELFPEIPVFTEYIVCVKKKNSNFVDPQIHQQKCS